jgi:penicillin-binding protein 1A
MEQEKKKRTRKKKGRKIFKGIMIAFLIICALTFAAGAGVLAAVVKSAPEIDSNVLDNLKQSSKIYDKDGHLIESLSGVEDRTIVPLKKIPKHVQDAFIAIEDERFREHHGIDIKRIFGAIWYDIKTMSKAQGASTITQQFIKNYVLSPEKKFTRKFQEMYLAIQLERKLSKDQILEAYLNTIYLGGNAYGVQSASMFYFGKDVDELTIAEAALIAGLNQSPARYYPFSKKNMENPKVYKDRQKTVLTKMLENGFITQKEFDEAVNQKLVFQTKKPTTSMKYQWFIEPAIDQIAEDFADKYDISEKEAKERLRTGGYNIYLTIDTKIQEAAQKIIDNPSYYSKLRVPSKLKTYSADGQSKPKVEPQAAAVIFDYRTGEMRAIIGGRGPHELRSLNRATEVPRQPGSSIKPLAVYAPAIDSKIATPATIISDSPLTGDFNGWNPGNADGKFLGDITIREAIKRSRNLVAVKLGMNVGINTSINYLEKKFHISTLQKSGPVNDKNLPALTLGGMTHGVYPFEMAAAYGVFGNEGVYSKPIMYTKVTDRNGTVILEKHSEQSRALSPQAAYIMVDMMKDVVKGGEGATGTNANFGAMPAAGKTGTASDNTNAWFVGLTPYYSGAVWIGHDKPNTKVQGLLSSLSAKMWGDIMKEAHKGLEVKDFERPSGIVWAQVCIDSGKAPSELCAQDSRGSRVRSELFIEGTQPVELCDVHVTANIDIRTGKLATPNTPPEYVQTKVFTKSTMPTEYSDAPTIPQEPNPKGDITIDNPDGTDENGNDQQNGENNNNPDQTTTETNAGNNSDKKNKHKDKNNKDNGDTPITITN